MDTRRATGFFLEAVPISVAHDDLAVVQTEGDFSTVGGTLWRHIRVVVRSVDVTDTPAPPIVIFDCISAPELVPHRLIGEFHDRIDGHRLSRSN